MTRFPPLLLICLAALPVAAGIVHVPADQPTIQTGIEAAADGDTVEIACGTYYEHNIILRPSICIRGATGMPEGVVIDAQQQGHVILIGVVYSNISITIEGLTLRGGSAPGSSHGGGLRVFTDGWLVAHNCIFEDNFALGGGAVYLNGCESQLWADFIDCRFENNSAVDQGGAVWVDY
ncbi:MAG: hypothetical protein ABIE70_09350 [bacterium]